MGASVTFTTDAQPLTQQVLTELTCADVCRALHVTRFRLTMLALRLPRLAVATGGASAEAGSAVSTTTSMPLAPVKIFIVTGRIALMAFLESRCPSTTATFAMTLSSGLDCLTEGGLATAQMFTRRHTLS